MNAPKRWKEPGSGASPALRSVLSYAGRRTPDAAYAAALTGAVLAQVQAPGLTLAATSTLKASATATGGKLLALTLAVALAGAGGAALYLARESAAPGDRDVPRAAAVTSQAPHSPTRAAAPPQSAPALAPEAPAPAVQVKPESAARSARPRPKRARTEASTDELGLLQAARVARTRSETRALALLRQHERSFPESLLREERDALLIELLSRSEPRAAAERAADFLQRFPRSPYRERVMGFSLSGR